MSGGHFDYEQYRINTIADSILDIIRENEDGYEDYPEGVFYDYGTDGKIKDKPDGWQRYTDDIIEKIKEGYRMCRIASIYAQRIDWLVSGDDGEKQFHSRLNEDLENIELEIKKLDERNWNIGKKKEDIEEL
jgi:hypothetical protein